MFLNQCQLLNVRLTRWLITLLEFNLEIIHIPGRENVGADTLTRYPQSQQATDPSTFTSITINKLILYQYSRKLQGQFLRLGELQSKDSRL